MLLKQLLRSATRSSRWCESAKMISSRGYRAVVHKPPLSSANFGQIICRNFSSEEKSDPTPKSEETEQNDPRLKLLMNFTPRGMPNVFYSLKNLYILNFVLHNQIDRSFNIKEFIDGAKQALVVVSSHLANNEFDKLANLVDSKAMDEIKVNYDQLSVAERKELEFHRSDIVLCFAHNISVQTLKEDFTGTCKHIVHFFVVYDCIKNLEQILKEKHAKRAGAGEIFHELADQKYICNYEFRRVYTDNHEPSDWTITRLLHIKEKDLVHFTRSYF